MSRAFERVAVVGLGYVGLPLAVHFGRLQPTIGLEVDGEKLAALREGRDPAGDLTREDLAAARHLRLTEDPRALAEADVILVAVPTPVNAARSPDLGPLRQASRAIGENMKRGAVVVYESTVYPGATEEVCIPVLEKSSGLSWKRDFHVGYSPERINPGDREHTLTNTVKVVAADDGPTLEAVAALYAKVVKARIHKVSSIAVAEAAKVIENTQRDLNIALMNELAVIFHRLGLDTTEVLEAAGTKWNFLAFRPGLVGGHCIGVDPYYLTYKAEMAGYHPQVILAGRRINDGMGKFVAEQTVKRMIAAGSAVKGARVNILGMTFKEDVPDLRNSKVVDMVEELRSYGIEVAVHDPMAHPREAEREYGIRLASWEELPRAEALILAVAHRKFIQLGFERLSEKLAPGGCFVDVKSRFDRGRIEAAGFGCWRL
ncbi:MAG: nucleotide sugar dehydrogenase [Clostridia bacterium]